MMKDGRFFHFTPGGGENKTFWVATAAAVLIFALIALPLVGGRFYTFDDLARYHLPFRYFYAQSLAAGDSFIWLPNIYCGFYLHGDGSVGMYHPLHYILYRALPFTAAFDIEMLLNYPLMIAGMFLFLRRWSIRRDASMLGAIMFAFSGFNTLHFTHMNAVVVAAHIPWLLLAIDVFMRETDARLIAFAGLGVALLTGSELLLGHPQVFWFSSMAEALYALFLTCSWRKSARLLKLGVTKAVGVMVGGAQLLPTWDAISTSIRPETFSQTWPMLHPLHLVQLVAPYFFRDDIYEGVPYELKIYNGAIPLALLVLLAIRRKELGSLNRLAIGSFVLGTLAAVLSLGEYGYLYRIQPHLPFIGMLRAPCRYILLFHLSSAVWSAIAFAHLSELAERGDRISWNRLWPFLLAPAISMLPPLFSLGLIPHPALNRYFVAVAMPFRQVIAGPTLFILVTAMIVVAMRGRRYALVAVILLAAADLGAYGLIYMRKFPQKEMDSFLKSRPIPSNALRYRLKSSDNVLLMKGVRITEGYSSIPPKKQLADMSEARLKVAGARWIWARYPRFLGGTAYGLPLPEPLPRARLVTKAVVSSEPNEDIETIDIETTALVPKKIDLVEGPPGKAAIVRDRPGMIGISTETESRQLLVVSDSYHEGWQATVDGEDKPVVRVYGDFMGCVVDAGKHEVKFEFHPKSLRAGKWLSILGLALASASFFSRLFRHGKNAQTE